MNLKQKIKSLTKKNKIEEEKHVDENIAFSEFDIDKDVLDELDNLEIEQENNELETINELEDTIEKVEDYIEETDNFIDKTKEELTIVDVEKTTQELNMIDINSQEYSTIIRENINFCTKEIKEISVHMEGIEKQKNGESFWKKSENIKTISRYVSRITDVQQKTLDLLVLILGASGKMVDDYDTIMSTIDELSDLNGGEAEVLNYLLKVKKMIKEIKDNDQRLKDIMNNNKILINKAEDFEKKLQNVTNNNIQMINNVNKEINIEKSKNKRLEGKINRNSFYIFLSFLLTAGLGGLFYLWFR